MLKFVSRRESQISETKRTEICWTNSLILQTGYNTPQLAAELGFRACPKVHTRDLTQ